MANESSRWLSIAAAALLLAGAQAAAAPQHRASDLEPAAAAIHNQCARTAARDLSARLTPMLRTQGRGVLEAELSDRVAFGDLVRLLAVTRDGARLSPSEHFAALYHAGDHPEVQARFNAANEYAAALQQRYQGLTLAIDHQLPRINFTDDAARSWLQQLDLALREVEGDAMRQRRGLQRIGLDRDQGIANARTVATTLTGTRILYEQCVYRGVSEHPTAMPALRDRRAQCLPDAFAGQIRSLTSLFEPSALFGSACLEALRSSPADFDRMLQDRLHASSLTAPPPPPGSAVTLDRAVLNQQPLTLSQIQTLTQRAHLIDTVCHRDAFEPFADGLAAVLDAGERQMLARADASANARLAGARSAAPFARERMAFERMQTSATEHLARLRAAPAERRATLGDGNVLRTVQGQRRMVEHTLDRIDVDAVRGERDAEVAAIRARYAEMRSSLSHWREAQRQLPAVERAGRIHGPDDGSDPISTMLVADMRVYSRELRRAYADLQRMRTRQSRACWESNARITGIGALQGGGYVCGFARSSASHLQRLALVLLTDSTLRRCRAYPAVLSTSPDLRLGEIPEGYYSTRQTIAAESHPNGWPTIEHGIRTLGESIAAINGAIAGINGTLSQIYALLSRDRGEAIAGLTADLQWSEEDDAGPPAPTEREPPDPESLQSVAEARCSENAAYLSRIIDGHVMSRPWPVQYDGLTGAPVQHVGSPCETVICPTGGLSFEECRAASASASVQPEQRYLDWDLYYQLDDGDPAHDAAVDVLVELYEVLAPYYAMEFNDHLEALQNPRGDTELERFMDMVNTALCYGTTLPLITSLGDLAGWGLEHTLGRLGHPGLSESCDMGVTASFNGTGVRQRQSGASP